MIKKAIPCCYKGVVLPKPWNKNGIEAWSGFLSFTPLKIFAKSVGKFRLFFGFLNQKSGNISICRISLQRDLLKNILAYIALQITENM